MLCPYDTMFGLASSKDRLPVAAVATAVSAIASAATTTAVTAASATAAPSATTAATTVAASTACAATFTLRTGFVHDERAAEKFLAIQSRDGLFGFGVIFDFRETKTARLPGETIAKQSERIGLYASFRKQRSYFLFSSLER
jgi:hypothetical protein